VQPIRAILFEPVGCLAEFPAEPFIEIAARVFGRKKKPSRSASRAYWHVLNLLEAAGNQLTAAERRAMEDLEMEAARAAAIYEDVAPALSELNTMGVGLFIASSLSGSAMACFLQKCADAALFAGVWNRETAGGVKSAPLLRAISGAAVSPPQAMFLTDTAEGLKAAATAGVNSILMMNDPDEARRLAMQQPAGGIVSLHELPDFVRLVAAKNAGSQRSG
jgi:beta-phosphoglucomutase-like phosphatase (HAD superfamily)